MIVLDILKWIVWAITELFKWTAKAIFWNFAILIVLGAMAIVILGIAYIIFIQVNLFRKGKNGLQDI